MGGLYLQNIKNTTFFNLKYCTLNVLAISLVSELLHAPFQIMMLYVSVYLCQVKHLKGSLTLIANTSNLGLLNFCDYHNIANFIPHLVIQKLEALLGLDDLSVHIFSIV